MAKPKLLCAFSLSLLCLISLSAADSSVLDNIRLAGSSFPSVHAKELIRGLNLFPKEEINIVDQDRVPLQEGPKLVEKRFMFPNLEVPAGVPVEDLGHHAGYYKLANSHDAR
ncbi:serine carboxypeptidase-like 49 [Hibiscus syriacus]|uniref:serine carboxypeptidase-like 49 n=1 Tax=Hibiscus syriacus TaxID=106335 RepID=UPI0019208260|nr:serine carboxypeptidase-like 49 [Hibiscus syriacus]